MNKPMSMTIAEYHLKQNGVEFKNCTAYQFGYKVSSVIHTTPDDKPSGYWVETEGGCGSFPGTDTFTLTWHTESAHDTPPLDTLLATIDGFIDEVKAYDEIAVIRHGDIGERLPEAHAALETLRERVAMMGEEWDALLKDIERIADNYAYTPPNYEAEEYSGEAGLAFSDIVEMIKEWRKQS